MPGLICIFENHMDPVPKHLIRYLLLGLKKFGYDTFCVEHSEKSTAQEMQQGLQESKKNAIELKEIAETLLKKNNIDKNLIKMHFEDLAKLMHLYVSSTHWAEIAREIKSIPAYNEYETLLNFITQKNYSLAGLDINEELCSAPFGIQEPRPDLHSEELEHKRITKFCENLVKLLSQNKSIIFLCGLKHADSIINNLAEKKENAHYYTVYSPTLFNSFIDPKKYFFDLSIHPLNKKILVENDKNIRIVAKNICSDIWKSTKTFKQSLFGFYEYKDLISFSLVNKYWNRRINIKLFREEPGQCLSTL